jgi:hypothetical protein
MSTHVTKSIFMDDGLTYTCQCVMLHAEKLSIGPVSTLYQEKDHMVTEKKRILDLFPSSNLDRWEMKGCCTAVKTCVYTVSAKPCFSFIFLTILRTLEGHVVGAFLLASCKG